MPLDWRRAAAVLLIDEHHTHEPHQPGRLSRKAIGMQLPTLYPMADNM